MIHTIGHGNRTIVEFLGLLKGAGVTCLVDVRAQPASRRHPQFARAALERALEEAGIRYVWEGKALGGRRKLAENTPHVALRNPAFRAYAGYMASAEFRDGLERLLGLGREQRVAIMCAEREPAECHRCLIADSLAARGVPAAHIVTGESAEPHVLSLLARREGDRLVYDAGEQLPLKLR